MQYKDNNALPKKPPSFETSDFDAIARIKKLWTSILIDQEPPEEPPLLSINGICIATPANHTLLSGKKKTRKTLLLILLISWYNGDLEKDILWFDTEQGKRHVWKIRDKIKQLTGKSIPVFFLRGKSPQERRQIIGDTIRYWPTRPKIIVIDGIRDLMKDFNSIEETTELIVWEEELLVEFNVHVFNVLHQNKTDANPRGHAGTEFQNKCQTAIGVDKDPKTDLSRVYCESSRDEPFSEFAFTHDENGLPKISHGEKVKGELIEEAELRKRLKFVFDGQLPGYSDLIAQIKIHFEVGDTLAERLYGKFLRWGWIIKNGKDRARDTVYKLMITE